jgi:ribosomal protein S12 methylthiotransferase
MLGMLQKDRYQIVPEPEQAEVIIVNTCSFIQASKEESIETILEMAGHKQDGNCKVLVASGCLPQRYSKELEHEMPEVDLEQGAPLPKRSYIDQPAFIHTERDPRMHTGPLHTAYLKLSEGCNRRCAFCIIPKLRGNVRSRTVESLVAEAKQLAARGVRELNLVAQDLTEYGMEWKYKERLETLLPELTKIDGIEWIRLHYVYPDQFSDELVEIIAREPKIVKYLDMPIQHTNDRVLKSMNRRLTKAKLFDLVAKLRQKIPGVVFRTSIIVGFPGETEEEFQELCRDIESLRLDHVGVFRYSKEEGTKAAEMDGQIHPNVKRRRSKVLTEILQKQSLGRNERLVGLRFPLMIEGTSDETELLLQGRIPSQAQEIDGHVLINDISGLNGLLEAEFEKNPPVAGDLVEVEITEAMPHDLVGRIVSVIKRMRLPEERPGLATTSMPGLLNEWRALH